MAHPTGELTVDLRAIADNWKYIKSFVAKDVSCGAVVKANAYGLGVERVAPKLYGAGCRDFFVANIKEALQMRALVGLDARVYVLTGCVAGAEKSFIERQLTPVIVSYEMLERWALVAKDFENSSAVLKVNTGMGRLGLEVDEFQKMLANIELLRDARVECLMSHFACADEPGHPLNATQIERFNEMHETLQSRGVLLKKSIANSAGVFLGENVHGDMVRPGIVLYGGGAGFVPRPMTPVVGLRLPVIQVRRLPAGEYVGYGATERFDSPRLIAVVSGGYADGLMRSLGGKGWGAVDGVRVPIVGRISMDSTLFDVTDAPGAEGLSCGGSIELLGKHVTIDDLAEAAGTISYEMLTAFGARYQRCYIE